MQNSSFHDANSSENVTLCEFFIVDVDEVAVWVEPCRTIWVYKKEPSRKLVVDDVVEL